MCLCLFHAQCLLWDCLSSRDSILWRNRASAWNIKSRPSPSCLFWFFFSFKRIFFKQPGCSVSLYCSWGFHVEWKHLQIHLFQSFYFQVRHIGLTGCEQADCIDLWVLRQDRQLDLRNRRRRAPANLAMNALVFTLWAFVFFRAIQVLRKWIISR